MCLWLKTKISNPILIRIKGFLKKNLNDFARFKNKIKLQYKKKEKILDT